MPFKCHCAAGYTGARCTKNQHTNCRTSSGNGKGRPCVFPFMYKGKRYTACTKVDNGNTEWCATSTAMSGMVPSFWGYCPREGCVM